MVRSLIPYIGNHIQWDGRRAALTLRAQLALYEEETLAKHWLKGKCPELSGRSVLQCVEWHTWHFKVRDAQKQAHDAAWNNPSEGIVYARMDFAENWNLPIGPDEAGSWWYAGSRLSLSVLIITIWGKHFKTKYVTYVSKVLEKTPRYVVAVWDDLLQRSAQLQQLLTDASEFQMWVDSGTHFRCYSMLWWQCCKMPERFNLVGRMCFDLEHHGKEQCDGHIGKIKTWAGSASKAKLICDGQQLVEALTAENQKSLDANPSAPQCRFFNFTPPEKNMICIKTVSQNDMAKASMNITRSYCFSGTSDKRLHNHVFADKPSIGSIAAPVVPHTDDISGDNEAWRTAYRQREPENEDVPWDCLRRRFESQSHVGLPSASRHRTWHQHAEAQLLKAQKQQSRGATVARRLRAKSSPPVET